MSSINEIITINMPIQQVVRAVRSASRSFGFCGEVGENCFEIRDNVQGTNPGSLRPAKVQIHLIANGNDTVVELYASNFDIDKRESASKLGAVKAVLLTEVDLLREQRPS